MYPPIYPPPNPSIAAPPFRYHPMNMMQGPILPMQMMRPPMPNHQPMVAARPQITNTSTVVAPPILNKPSDNKPPVTTVFVGNIHDRAPDGMVKSMLQKCGNVLSWKRVQGASGKLQAFGFCEFEDPSSSIRCIHLLNAFNIIDKKLLVKVDAKTQGLLEDYKKKRDLNQKNDREEGENDEDSEKDEEVKVQLEIIIKEHDGELNKTSQDEPGKQVLKETKVNLEGMELEEDIKNLVNREIRSFRDTHLNSEKDVTDSRRRDENRDRNQERDRDRRERDRERREREKKRSPRQEQGRTSKEFKRSREVISHEEEEDDSYEIKRLERKIKEKEVVYQEMVRKWEERESRKSMEYERDRKREGDKRRKEEREAAKMREFFENYDDDATTYFRGSALQRRLHEREKELEADERDRRREREELEEIRKKLQEQGHPDLESEMARIELMREEHLMPQMSININQSYSPTIILEQDNDISQSTVDITMYTEMFDSMEVQEDSPKLPRGHPTSPPEIESPDSPVNNSMHGSGHLSDDLRGSQMSTNKVTRNMSFQMLRVDLPKLPQGSTSDCNKRKLKLSDVFNQDDEEQETSLASKMKRFNPIALADSNVDLGGGPPPPTPTSNEEKRVWIKNFIEQIPATRNELFAFSINWSLVDQELVDKRIKPWVNKKIIEYIGEDEPTLTDFICTKISSHTSPDTILSEVSMVLDEESEEFVMKLWRLLIFEAEAKRNGIDR